jgi:hypothetical protein
MGWRFYRRFKVLPGVTLNWSRRGVSTSIGVKGAHITLGRRQVRSTVGLPGSGISYTHISHQAQGEGAGEARRQDVQSPRRWRAWPWLLIGLGALACCVWMAVTRAADIATADTAHRKMPLLCDWKARHMPRNDKIPLTPCDPDKIAAASSESLNEAMKAYWLAWGNPKSMMDSFEIAYLEKYPHLYTAAEVASLSTADLCGLVRMKDPAAPMAIHRLRSSFMAQELQLIRAQQIQIGMSEEAMKCSLGSPERRNRTVTARGERIQWIYGTGIVYTDNGKVIAFQD